MINNDQSSFYKVGGSLPINVRSYITRPADQEYYEALLNGEFCYVLNARQTGKSSLKIKTIARLKQHHNIRCVAIDFGLIGTQYLSPSQLYASFLGLLCQGLDISITVGKWWREHEHLPYIERLHYFLESVIFDNIQEPIMIFLDEIDSLLGLRFSCQEFFNFIVQCYEKRKNNPQYHQLNISILGTGNFLELARNTHDHPFSSGRHILLTNFTIEEAQPLLQGFTNIIVNQQETLTNILKFTGGQPFLTQKLCYLLVKDYRQKQLRNQTVNADWLRNFVDEKIIKNWIIQDDPEHLKTILDRILNVKDLPRTLRLYQDILQGKQIQFMINQVHIDLYLSGLVTRKTGFFQLNNHIYTTIFNHQWLEEKLNLLLEKDQPCLLNC